MGDNENLEYNDFLSKIYIRYSKELFEAALIRLGREEDAKDALSETFYIATLKVEALYDHPNKIAWLYRVLGICIKRILYRNVIRNKPGEVNASSGSEFDDKYKRIEVISINNDSSDIYLSNHSYKDNFYEENMFEDFKDILTKKELMYIIYKFEYDYDNKTISNKLGISYSATTSLGNRAKNKIKKLYNKRDKI